MASQKFGIETKSDCTRRPTHFAIRSGADRRRYRWEKTGRKRTAADATKLQGVWQTFEDEIDHRPYRFGRIDILGVGRNAAAARPYVGLAEIAPQQAAQIASILDNDRSRAHFDRDFFHHVGGAMAPRSIAPDHLEQREAA